MGWKRLLCIDIWCQYLELGCLWLIGVGSQHRLGHDQRVCHGCGQSG